MDIFLILVVLGFIGLQFVSLHNKLVAARVRVDEGWSSILVQLKRRHDLVPNLVASVEKATRHESGILDTITRARAVAVRASHGGDANAAGSAEAALSGTLAGLIALAESNPEISATQNISLMQEQLAEIEDQIAAARSIYNANVRNYNIRVHTIPSSFIAAARRFEDALMFTVPDTEVGALRAPPRTW